MGEDPNDLEEVSRALGHAFADPGLLRDALTHRSFANERRAEALPDNERLEFLGDSVLSALISAMLFREFPAADEGELTRRRADLVSETALAPVARELGVGRAMRLGRGEERSGGRDKARLLASSLEACVGAVFLDGGWETAVRVVDTVFSPRFCSELPGGMDYKSRVQILVQSRGKSPPTYKLVRAEGPDHDPSFVVSIDIDGVPVAQGRGRSKAEAEQDAAARAFAVLSSSGETGT